MILAYAQLAASMALVGLNVVVLRVLATEMPVPVILGLRCTLAALVLLPFVWRRLMPPGRGAMLNLGGQAAVGSVLYNVLLVLGVQRTGALEAGLVLAALPAVVAVGALLFLGERLSWRRAMAALLAGLGMAALAFGRGGGLALQAVGDLLVLGDVVMEAAYMLLAKVNAARVPPLVAAFWMQVLSAAFVAPFAAAAWPGAMFTMPNLALTAFHGLTASVLAVVLWYAGLRRVPANTAGVFAGMLPLTAGAAATVLLSEPVAAAHGVGAVLMLGSIALATWPWRAGRPAS